MKLNSKKVVLSGIFIAISVLLSSVYIPIGIAKVLPAQHFINVLSGVVLGPVYAMANAFISSLIRNILGTGSLLAFPGSMIGALLAGILYRKFKILFMAVIGEVIGTGIFGAILSYPVAKFLLGKEGAIFMFVVPFILSCTAGAIIAYAFLKLPVIKKQLSFMNREN